MAERNKYIQHLSGVPIRIPPYLRLEASKGEGSATVQLEMIRRCPVVGERSEMDTLPINLQENIALRKIARLGSHELVAQAVKWGINRYCVTVHGSLARGVVRHPSNSDRSDIDIDLIIDSTEVSKEERKKVRQKMYELSPKLGARIDAYVWNMDEMRRNCGLFSRLTLAASAYPLANKNGLWEEVRWIGIETERFLLLNKRVRKKILRIIQLISQDKNHEINTIIQEDKEMDQIFEHLLQCKIMESKNPKELAISLYAIYKNNC